jgi:ribosomal 50S subunit-recycling heat shock protein
MSAQLDRYLNGVCLHDRRPVATEVTHRARIAVLREECIRSRQIIPETETERRWALEGPRPEWELEANKPKRRL